MRRAAKIDSNQPQIIAALRKIGAFVAPTHMVGGGFPDIAVRYRGVWYLQEIKDGLLAPSKRVLTPAEAEFHAQAGPGAVQIVETVAQALEAVTG